VQHCSRLIGASKQASRKNVVLAYIMIKFGNLWSKPSYKVVDDISPIDDIRSTADWRRKVSPVLVKRALIEALKGVYLA